MLTWRDGRSQFRPSAEVVTAMSGPVDELEALGLRAVQIQKDVGELEVLLDNVVAFRAI